MIKVNFTTYYTIILISFFYLLSGVSLAQDVEEDEKCEPTKNKKAEKLYQKAIDNLSTGSYREAAEILKEAVGNDSDYYEAYFMQGIINIRQSNRYRKLSLASESFTQVVEICPSYENYYANFYLGDILFGRKSWSLSVKYLKAFIDNVNPVVVPEKDTQISKRNAAKKEQQINSDYTKAEDLLLWAEFYDRIYNNKVIFDPQPIEGLSTTLGEYQLMISPDNETAYFIRAISLVNKNLLVPKAEIIEKLFSSTRKADGQFEEGQKMDYPFNVTPNSGSVSITIDNKVLYLTICKPTESGYKDCDICRTDFDGEYWLGIYPLDSNINTKYWESTPSITSDGKTLYFASNKPGGFGGADIYRSTIDEKGVWSMPVNLGPAVNTAGNEISPFIHTDSRTLYFSSGEWVTDDGKYMPGHMGLGDYDIFFIRLDEKGGWTEPMNIGYPINSEKADVGFIVSTDGKTGYFASDRLNGRRDKDIYAFDLYKDARPEQVLFIKGQLKDEESDKPIRKAKIELKNVVTKEITEIPIDIETGKYVAALVFKNDYVLTIKKEDYAYETKYISKKARLYEAPTTIDIEIKPLKIGYAYPLNDINFETNSDSLTEASMSVIDGFIDYLKEFTKIEVAIHGHTDAVGSAEDNLILSSKRAKSVYEYMILKGIKASRLRYKGFGEEKPIATNATEEGKAKNRRTEFVIIKK
ncbi:MAG: OmpA family protein [Bacteroidetes bacterium]|nr:OmpA family protein [Bacteroidota bacterium]